MSVSRPGSRTTFSLSRGAWGVLLLTAPGPLTRVVNVRAASPTLTAIIRVLGGREILQAAVTAMRPQPGVLLAGAAVDVTHGSSMILLAAREPKLRSLAGLSAATSAVLAAVGVGKALRERKALD